MADSQFTQHAQRRKSSVAAAALERANQDHIDVVEDIALLDEADRRLAELGYIQVHLKSANSGSSVLTINRHLGVQARVLMAIMLFLRHVHIGTLCQCRHDICISARSRWRCICRVVLADIRLRRHVYSIVGV